MLTRIVKMTFRPDKVQDFLKLYHETHDKIAASKGCNHLELLNDIHEQNVMFTYSLWDSEQDLLNYRNSELFSYTWEQVKHWFEKDAEAWSMKEVKKF